MSDSQFAEDSIEAMLVAIADGVREAQQALSEAPPVDAYGRPQPRYQLPYVDFNIQVMMDSVTTGRSGGRGIMKFLKPNTTTNKELTSTISGRLTAVPPGDGLPLPRLQATTEQTSARKYRIDFLASNSAGEALAGHHIEVNFNLAASIALSKSAGRNVSSAGSSRLADAVLLTDANGNASTNVTIDSRIPAGAVLVYSAEVASATVNVAIKTGAS